jgi:hypothetical protein
MIKTGIVFIRKYIKTIIYCSYLFTAGIFFPKCRYLIHKIYTFLSESIIPKISISEIAADDIWIQINGAPPKDGNISISESFVINKLIKYYNPQTIFEIGTFDGLTTLNMAANCSKDAKIYTLDLPSNMLNSHKLPLVAGDARYINKKISGGNFLGTDYEKKIEQLYGDSATFDFSPFYNMIDFVFIDGSHSYQYVLNDSKIALKLLKNKSGIILWHDYGEWWDVTEALNKLYLKVNEFKNVKHIEGTLFAMLILVQNS